MPEKHIYDTIIIGGGVAGLAAAIYAGRFEMKTLLITNNIGGTVINAHELANFPGVDTVSGIQLVERMQAQAEKFKSEIAFGKVEKIENEKKLKCFMISAKDKEYYAKTIIIATGTEWRKLNVPGEKEYNGKGVHYCSICDGAFYKDKVVAVIGGADSAAKDALLLTKYAKKVFMIYRRAEIRPEPVLKSAILKNKKIEIIKNTNVVEIKGSQFVNKVILDKPYKGSKEFSLDAVFIAIGHIPVTGIAKKFGVALNDKGEIILDRQGFTNIQGIYAAGDVTDITFKQAITGVGEGVKAAYNAYRHIGKIPAFGSYEEKD